MKVTVYITPNIAFTSDKITNPYIADLANAWEGIGANVIRSPYVFWLRTADLFLYLNRVTILILNWPEDLYNRPLGRLQVWLLKQFIRLFRRNGGKVVWTMHNRTPHEATALHKQQQFIAWIQERTDLVVVHALEGLHLLPTKQHSLFFPHPFRPIQPSCPITDIKYDALIWGNLAPYKGVDLFLEFLHKCGLQHEFRILICGHCTSETYARQLKQWETPTIQIINSFVSDKELAQYFNQSLTVLFTHSGKSVLTSGTLAESLSHLKTVIAPNRGNFQDFSKKGLVHVFDSFEEIPELLTKCRQYPEKYIISAEVIKQVIKQYSWLDFVQLMSNNLYTATNE